MIPLYLDHNIPKAITEGLRLRGVDCLTAFEDNAATLDDPKLLERSTALGRALVTSDKDFLVEAKKRQTQSMEFAGVIFVHPLLVSVRRTIDDLEIIAQAGEPEDLVNSVQHLPL